MNQLIALFTRFTLAEALLIGTFVVIGVVLLVPFVNGLLNDYAPEADAEAPRAR